MSLTKITKVIVLSLIPMLLIACQHMGKSRYAAASGCAGNAFLQKFGCSLERVQREAERGNADAQYALGYMYYYGVGTVVDRSTAEKWIRRAAAQGQPLAKRALVLLARGNHFHQLGGRRGGGGGYSIRQAPADVAAMNSSQPDKPLSTHLPAYGKAKKRRAALNTLQRKEVKARSSSNESSGASSSQNKPVVTQPTSLRKRSINRKRSLARRSRPPANRNKLTARRASPKNISTASRVTSVESADRLGAATVAHRKPTRILSTEQSEAEARIETPTQASRIAMTAAERELMSKPENDFTLQLLGGRNLPAIQAYIKHNHLQDRARYYSAKYHGKTWYMLVYGDFASAAQADEAISTLPPALRKTHPWVKSYRVVHKEIKRRKIAS